MARSLKAPDPDRIHRSPGGASGSQLALPLGKRHAAPPLSAFGRALADLACYSGFRGQRAPKLFHPKCCHLAKREKLLRFWGGRSRPKGQKTDAPFIASAVRAWAGVRHARIAGDSITLRRVRRRKSRISGCALGGGCSRSHQANAKSWRASV